MSKALLDRKKAREEAIAAAKDFAQGLSPKLGKCSVIVYGSYARGDFNLWSDVDVLIVSDAFKGIRFLDRYTLFDQPSNFEVKPYTPTEFSNLREKPSWKQALKDAVVVRDDLCLFE
ncbi:nucleotidyltransferase domain-containing protein [Tardisphaera miroshnichenkoae]